MSSDPDRFAIEQLVDYWTPLLVRVAVETGIVDAFGTEWRTPAEVAATTALDADVVGRVLRALVVRGVFRSDGSGSYELTELGQRLRSGPQSLAGLAAFRPWEIHAWAEVVHALRSGTAAFEENFGQTYWEYLNAHPDVAALFNAQMQRRTASLLTTALPGYDWPTDGTVVDIGGGNGLLLRAVLEHRPRLRGVLFDLADVVAECAPLAEPPEIAQRVTRVGGDMFVDPLPSHGDLYVLSSVLHDWSDPAAHVLLERCRHAMPSNARLVLFESVLPDGDGYDLGKLVDLHMLVLFGARERTERDWRELLGSAGFTVTRVVPTPGLAWIEAAPHQSIDLSRANGDPPTAM